MQLTTMLTITDFYYEFLDRFSASYTRRILIETLDLLDQLWPYLVGGIIFSSTIKVFMSKERMAKLFATKRSLLSILFAAIIGVISPLGSYVIIPISAALFTVGVPLPILVTLMVSSPIINPNLFVLTAGAMGIELAIMRVVSALILGISAGLITQFLIVRKHLVPSEILKTNSESLQKWLNTDAKVSWKAFYTDLYRMTLFVSRYFFLAIFIAAFIKIFINPNWFSSLFSENLFLSVLLSTGAGVPFYVCGGAAIPVVQQLAELGMSKGAVLAFFISGPVTKISNLVILQGTFKKKVLFIYVFVGIIGALLLGLIYELVP